MCEKMVKIRNVIISNNNSAGKLAPPHFHTVARWPILGCKTQIHPCQLVIRVSGPESGIYQRLD
jgi:hypothetical protein